MSFFISLVGSPADVKTKIGEAVTGANVPKPLADLVALLCDDIALESNGIIVTAQGHLGGGFGSVELSVKPTNIIGLPPVTKPAAKPVVTVPVNPNPIPAQLSPATPTAEPTTATGAGTTRGATALHPGRVFPEVAPQHPDGSMPESAPRPGFTGVTTDLAPAPAEPPVAPSEPPLATVPSLGTLHDAAIAN